MAKTPTAANRVEERITWPDWIAKHGPAVCRGALDLWLDDLAIRSATADEQQSACWIDEAGTLIAGALVAGLFSENEARVVRQAWARKSSELFLRKLLPAERRRHLLDSTEGASFLTLKRRVAMLREIRVW
jgi:hypothetical protein